MYLRKLPSGKWQATVRMPSGRKVTATDRLQSVVKTWAQDLEGKYSQGEVRDPRAGEVKLGDWRDRVVAAQGIDSATAAKNCSLWRTHCRDAWATWPMNAITRVEAQGWVNQLRSTMRARHKGRPVTRDVRDVPTISAETVVAAVHVMSHLFKLAVKESPPLVLANPFADLDLPTITMAPVDFYEHVEADALYAAAEDLFGVGARALVEVGVHVGLRPGELYGLHGHRVDWMRGRLHVVDVMTRSGLRKHPKSKRSNRTVPVPVGTLERMSTLMVGRGHGDLVFTAAGGGPLDDGDFRNRVWYPAVEAAGVRRFPPRIMRHTAASWLVQDGVSLYKVQALLGHESFATTQRYAHLAPDAHEEVMASWSRRSAGARVAHDDEKAGPR